MDQNKMFAEEFIRITPIDKPEFIVRVRYIVELNAAYGEDKAKVFNLNRAGEEMVSLIADEEYDRLKKILIGDDSGLVIEVVE